jgi:hypothetical protein
MQSDRANILSFLRKKVKQFLKPGGEEVYERCAAFFCFRMLRVQADELIDRLTFRILRAAFLSKPIVICRYRISLCSVQQIIFPDTEIQRSECRMVYVVPIHSTAA